VTYAYLALGVATFIALFFVVAPYGRHTRQGFGPVLGQRVAWVLMEAPAVVVWAGIYFLGRHALELGPLVLLAVWQLHYLQRTVIFPLRIRPNARGTPLTIVLSAIAFNVLNAYVNARWVSELGSYPIGELLGPRFFVGLAMFLVGLAVNVHADGALAALRKPGETGYKIPRGGLFEVVSCPNYLGEIVEWTGWAILTWSLGGAAFAIYTAANLVPRALAHHAWYREKFADYPKGRRAIIPFLA
jgi:protein-S-isoprenylcysteine O-methyltransferase Ste14